MKVLPMLWQNSGDKMNKELLKTYNDFVKWEKGHYHYDKCGEPPTNFPCVIVYEEGENWESKSFVNYVCVSFLDFEE